jgi:hypothetical protein
VEIIDNLLSLNSRGIFPGPTECQKIFSARAKAIKSCSAEEALCWTKEIFDAYPDWVELRYEAKGLLPWEGAATWIEEDEEHGRCACIQLKASFLMRLYPQTEVIAHEMVHVMRLMFEENRFEEILAYRTSKNRFRRYFGPLFTRPVETKGFVLLMTCSWVLYWTEFLGGFSLGAQYWLWSPMLPLGWGIYRLVYSQKIFSKALKHLGKAIKQPKMSLAVALRLSDEEIELFARSSPDQILSFAEKKKQENLRWRQICNTYFVN